MFWLRRTIDLGHVDEVDANPGPGGVTTAHGIDQLKGEVLFDRRKIELRAPGAFGAFAVTREFAGENAAGQRCDDDPGERHARADRRDLMPRHPIMVELDEQIAEEFAALGLGDQIFELQREMIAVPPEPRRP